MKHILKLILSGYLLAILGYVLGLLLIVKVLMEQRRSGTTLAWILIIGFVPYIGVPLYLLVGGRKIKRRIARKQLISSQVRSPEPDIKPALTFLAVAVTDVFAALKIFSPVQNVSTRLIDDGKDAFISILEAVDKAREFIHLEFFIFKNDETGKEILHRLCGKLKEGVTVRLLLDSLGTFHVTERIFKDFLAAGGKLSFFLPVMPFRRKWSANLRNHRKLLIIDRHTVFTGGMNLAREYMGEPYAGERWKDLFLEVHGNTRPFQKVFLDDWAFATGDTEPAGNFMGSIPTPHECTKTIQVVPSGPDQGLRALYHGVLSALHHARESITIATPYYIPDEGIQEALEIAALRGLSVRLIVPQRSNHPLALWAGRSYYEDLLSSGVQIFEYQPTMLHAKAMVIDQDIGVIGSANMDYRSFNLNFELSVFLYNLPDVYELKSVLNRLIGDSLELSKRHFRRRSVIRKFCEDACRVFSPVL